MAFPAPENGCGACRGVLDFGDRSGYRQNILQREAPMRTALALVLALTLAGPAPAEGERAGDFDYYVLSLSWQPSWCALEGDGRRAPDCAEGTAVAWTLHGLWPQYEEGWPSDCPTKAANPTRRQTAGMADLMGSSGLAWYQWQKHGRCSGLSSEAYFALMRRAWESVSRPPVFARLDEAVRLPASVVEEAWLEGNPGLAPDMITVTCRDGHIEEARICLTKDLDPRPCAPDARRDCRLGDALLPPVR
jgi:ribonuclease T2